MTSLRAFFLHHRRLAALLLVLALCARALVPAGYMPAGGARILTVRICADTLGQTIVRQMVIPGQAGQHGDQHGEKGRADTPCHFAAMGHAMLGATDPVLLALALLFAFALAFLPLHAPIPARVAWLRPPLRGPPSRRLGARF
ncbi:MAG TPA: DUF2946 family protein [Novosphingobium sp.]|nr:DUF2946 family protein [Novosphingobium sp.]